MAKLRTRLVIGALFVVAGLAFAPAALAGGPSLVIGATEDIAKQFVDYLHPKEAQDIFASAAYTRPIPTEEAAKATDFLPALRAAGVAEATIRQVTVENPQRLFALA